MLTTVLDLLGLVGAFAAVTWGAAIAGGPVVGALALGVLSLAAFCASFLIDRVRR